jgi:signal transduction histidine kinase
MFNNARIKLTAWYLLIIMFISTSFSFVIYHGMMNEVRRFSRIQRIRMERIDENIFDEIRQRILIELGIINIFIFITSGGLGYFLAEKTLRPIQEMVEEQNRFISDASHEIRTPLTSLKSSFEVNLRDKNLNLDQAKKVIKESINDVDKLQQLTDSLLNLTQYQKSNKQYFQPVQIKKIIDQSIQKLKNQINNKQIKVIVKINDQKVNGVELDLVNAFANIIDNAVKYSSNGTIIKIQSRIINSQLNVEIKDQGIGIDKKDIPLIFDRFYRVDQSRSKTKIIGYGLGLSIVKNIIENHHGKIIVNSRLKKGTTFIVTLPISG